MGRGIAGRIYKVSLAIEPAAEEEAARLFEEAFGQPPSVEIDVQRGTTRVSIYLKTKPSREQTAALARDVGELSRGGLRTTILPPEDWAESWKRHFQPLAFGNRLLVRPSWSRRKPTKGQALVELDPGLSFGTGQHPTTRFCLEEIVAHTGGSLLDIGTGSGILAIAGAKLGFCPIAAIDFDPVAVRIAKQNARRNRAENRIQFARKDLTAMPLKSARKYQLVCANLIYDVLISERRKIVNRLGAGGKLVLAGILGIQFPEVAAAFQREGLRLVRTRKVNEWRSGVFDFS